MSIEKGSKAPIEFQTKAEADNLWRLVAKRGAINVSVATTCIPTESRLPGLPNKQTEKELMSLVGIRAVSGEINAGTSSTDIPSPKR